jgi:hypothetical protein
MFCSNLPIIKNKLLNKFAPKIAAMDKGDRLLKNKYGTCIK